MATATGQRFSNGSLNSYPHGKYPGASHHHTMHGLVGGDDDTGGPTEQFPPFDPSHDGTEEDYIINDDGRDNDDDDDDDDYAHFLTRTTRAMNRNSDGSVTPEEQGQEQDRGKYESRGNALQHDGHGDDQVGEEDEGEEQPHTPMSNLDPVPESDLHRHQQQKAAQQSQPRDDNASETSAASETTTTTATTVFSPVTSPPYWALAHTNNDALHPSSSSHHHHYHQHHGNQSAESLIPGAITLQDNEAEEDDDDDNNNDNEGQGDVNDGEPQRQRTSEETRTSYGRDRNKACWAKSVEVTNYVIVNGSATNIGAFVVWNIRVQTLSVSPFFFFPPPSFCPSSQRKRGEKRVSHEEGEKEREREGRKLSFTDWRGNKTTGPLHEHSKTILGIRRLPAPLGTDVSQLRGRGAGTAPQERHRQVPAPVPREEAGRAAILSQVCSLSR